MIRQVRILLLLMHSLEGNFIVATLAPQRSGASRGADDQELSTLLLRRDVRRLISSLQSLRNKAGLDLDGLMDVAGRSVLNASQDASVQLDPRVLTNFRETLKSGIGRLDHLSEAWCCSDLDIKAPD